MIQTVHVSEADLKAIADIRIDPAILQDDLFDYSKVIVKKPWGYEYLIYKNESVAIWILFIKKGFQTSMHCHRQKKTSLILLSGKALCSTLTLERELEPANGLLLYEGVFHSTKSLSDEGIFLMEIETPVNKRDLIRLKDNYGREGKGYETIDNISFNIENYNYIPFIDPIPYNTKKRFGKCSISLKKFNGYQDLKKSFDSDEWDAISIIKGRIINPQEKTVLSVGDIITPDYIKLHNNALIEDELEILIVKRIDKTIKVSDYIISFLEKVGIKDIFAVPGSTNVHLLDSLGKHNNLRHIITQTEQGATTAAEAYAKLTGQLGVVIISAGSAGTSALTGIADAWIDSTPLLVISGQSNSSPINNEENLRQLGIQEFNFVDTVKKMTKTSLTIKDPNTIKYHLQKAIHLATTDRPGPVLIDIPIDILGAIIDEEELQELDLKEFSKIPDDSSITENMTEVIRLFESSKRPVLLAGNGIRLGNAELEFEKLISKLGIPVLTSRRGADLLHEDHPLFFGRPGAYGQRAANFIIQNSDLLISLGSRLSLPQIGRNYNAFARNAKKVVVDIDMAELKKKTIKADVAICCNVKNFIQRLLSTNNLNFPDFSTWIEKCSYWKNKYPQSSELGYQTKSNSVNAYIFIENLAKELQEGDIVTIDGGSPIVFFMQAFKFKSKQRVISATGLENTFFALPAAIGAGIGSNLKRIVCICEDTGFQRNISELRTIIKYNLPIKVFVINSGGDSYIQKTQESYFGGRYIGSYTEKAYTSPDISKIGQSYNFQTYSIKNSEELIAGLKLCLRTEGPLICKVNIDKNQQITPRITFTVKPEGKWISKPLEDMYPLMERQELRKEMFIGPFDED